MVKTYPLNVGESHTSFKISGLVQIYQFSYIKHFLHKHCEAWFFCSMDCWGRPSVSWWTKQMEAWDLFWQTPDMTYGWPTVEVTLIPWDTRNINLIRRNSGIGGRTEIGLKRANKVCLGGVFWGEGWGCLGDLFFFCIYKILIKIWPFFQNILWYFLPLVQNVVISILL